MAPNPAAPSRYHCGVAAGDSWTGVIEWDPQDFNEAWSAIHRTRRPARIFLGDMTDLFHPASPRAALEALASALGRAPERHRYILCTKRPEQLLLWQREFFPDGLPETVWILASISTQADADRMVPTLLWVQARVRGVSAEPLLGHLNLLPYLFSTPAWRDVRHDRSHDAKPALSWVIVGGESGPDARPMHPAWARRVRDQAVAAGVPYFFKQWGTWGPRVSVDGTLPEEVFRTGARHRGSWLDGREWREVPDALPA
jgi:protein gp37